MYCLSSLSTTKPLTLASLPTNNDSHSHSPPLIQTNHTNTRPPTPMHITIPQPKTTLPTTKKQKQKRKQPSIEEIERAISAGRYRDIDPKELEELDKSKFDLASMSFGDKFESPVEKKLRETGESLETWTQNRKKGPHVCVSMGNTNLDFVNFSGLWAHQATIQHPIS
ncbi:probable NAD(P)H dehydrogenase subunit CRR3, chloroplastic isoform X2 [Quercus robur]|uniref:probable NAD(P)H dehydrogenase subunit CRR3, chloroplastic isoform X2 n=1 Tax=Quercus robur TaxID=38942 RepID=UPI002162C892|nr:probable NAD(P)H dehydrogenase subunit CRR3, chloroplastic isoform X2 [Quercus robur]